MHYKVTAKVYIAVSFTIALLTLTDKEILLLKLSIMSYSKDKFGTFDINWPRHSTRFHKEHRENTRREESKYLECENRQLALIAIALYIFKPPTEKFKIGR